MLIKVRGADGRLYAISGNTSISSSDQVKTTSKLIQSATADYRGNDHLAGDFQYGLPFAS